MTKIQKVVLSKFRNGEHFQFMTDVKELITATPPAALGLEADFPVFENAYAQLDQALRVDQGSVLTEKLQTFDGSRDNTWSALNERVKATLLCPIPAEVEAAKALKRVFDLYGNIRHLSYNEQTAATSNLVADLESEANAPHCATMGITHWVAELRNQNDEFKSLLNQRNTEYANKNSGNVKEARMVIDPYYEEIVNRVNAMLTLNMATPEIENFVKELNQKIKYYESTLATRAGRNDNGEEETPPAME